MRGVDPSGLLPRPGGGGGPIPGGGRRAVPDPIYPPGYGLALCFVPRGRGGNDGSGGIGGGGGGSPIGSMCAGGICAGARLGSFVQVNYQDGQNNGNGNGAPATGPCAGIDLGKMPGENWCKVFGRLSIEVQKCVDKEGPLRRDCNSECREAFALQLCGSSGSSGYTMAYCLACPRNITPSCHALQPVAACCLKLQNAVAAALALCTAEIATKGKLPKRGKKPSRIRRFLNWFGSFFCDSGDDGDDPS